MAEEDSGIKARFQKAGFLWKLPMSKCVIIIIFFLPFPPSPPPPPTTSTRTKTRSASSEKWQKRFFVAKDGFLLYYVSGSPTQTFFDTKPKGIIPLGGCKVEKLQRGPQGGKFGLKISHHDFAAGKMLVLSAEKEDDQRGWEKALNDCSRVTMENALLGDGMIEQLRAAGSGDEAGAAVRLKALQDEALRIKFESEEKLRLLQNSDALIAQAKSADVRVTCWRRDAGGRAPLPKPLYAPT
jgi:hypothetical protein